MYLHGQFSGAPTPRPLKVLRCWCSRSLRLVAPRAASFGVSKSRTHNIHKDITSTLRDSCSKIFRNALGLLTSCIGSFAKNVIAATRLRLAEGRVERY